MKIVISILVIMSLLLVGCAVESEPAEDICSNLEGAQKEDCYFENMKCSKISNEQIRELCDKISDEENEINKLPEYAPEGSNVLLVIEVPGKTKNEVGFVGLERNGPETYQTVLWTALKKDIDKGSLRRRNTWEIKEFKPEKVLKEYAKIIKFMRGE